MYHTARAAQAFLNLCTREASVPDVEGKTYQEPKVTESFTYQIHNADNRQTSRRYSLTMAQEQTSDAANQYCETRE